MDEDLSTLDADFESVFLDYAAPTTFPLFKLPTELWLKVLQFAVVSNDPINVTRAPQSIDQARYVQQPAITRTCRLLRKEGLPMFYRKNEFEAWHICSPWKCPRQWVLAMGKENLLKMGTLRIYTEHGKAFWDGCFERAGLECASIEMQDTKKVWKCPVHGGRIMDTQVAVVTFS